MANFIFDALKEIKEKEERKPPMRIYLDKGEIKEEKLKDSAGSLYNPVKEIHDYLFS